MKIFIVAEGIGYGHMSRCLPLINYLSSKDYDLHLFSFKDGYIFAKENGLEITDLGINYELPKLLNFSEHTEVINYIKSINIKEILKFNEILKKERPDILISDSNMISLLLAKINQNIKTISIVNGTDLSIFSHNLPIKKSAKLLSELSIRYSNKVVIPDFPPPYTISLHNITFFNMEEKFNFIGPMVRRIKNTSYTYRLISLGGTNSQLIKKLNKKYVSTNSIPNAKLIKKSEYLNYFENAEVILSHGGHTTIMEAIMAEKPIVAIASGKYAERDNNCRRIDELQIGKMLDAKWINEEILEFAIEQAKDRLKNLKQFSKLAKKLQACKRMEQIIKETIEE